MNFSEGQKVKFSVCDSCKGTGIIRGMATTALPVIGINYIIEIVESSIDKSVYPYSHFAVFECHLTPVE